MSESREGAEAPRAISRGDLLKRAGLVGAIAAVPAGLVTQEATASPAVVEREQLENFTAAEAETLEAIVERLIPTDANGPGAREARVARYIDRALGGALTYVSEDYSIGLSAVDAYAQQTYGARFVNLTPAQQDAVLMAVENNTATGFPNSRTFFLLVREHTLQGMFGDPYHGGNANFVGWDLISFPGIKLSFPAQDQRLDADVRPAHKSTTDYDIFRISRRR